MTTIAIITVTTTRQAEALHGDDRAITGVYGVAMGNGRGEYPDVPRNAPEEGADSLVEAALDVFHDHVGIKVLDDFDIGVRMLDPDETEPEGVHWL